MTDRTRPRMNWQRRMPALVLVLTAAVVAYGVAVLGVFVYDDHHSVRENTAIRTLANVPEFFTDVQMFSNLDNRMYRPVLLCTYAVNYAVNGLEPWVFKATNVLLHALAASLLLLLARRLGAKPAGALLGALLFAVHPLASEAVNMVSGRSELLAACAILGGLLCYCAALAGRRFGGLGAGLCTAVACGSKETGVVVVGLAVLLEVVHARRHGWRPWPAVQRILPVVSVVIGYLWIRRALFGVATLPTPRWSAGGDVATGASRDLLTQLCTMANALPGVLGQVVFPRDLTIDPHLTFTRDLSSSGVWLGLALVLLLTAWALRPGRKWQLRAVGTMLAGALALPWLVIPLNVPLSEHRYYGPLAGLMLVAAGLWPRRQLAPGLTAKTRYGHRLRLTLTAAVLLAFAGLAARRSLMYRDERGLWEHAHELHPESYRACYAIGVDAMLHGKLEESLLWMQRALQRYPDYVSAERAIAELHLQLDARGNPAEALRFAQRIVQREPANPFHLLILSRAQAAVAAKTGDDQLFDAAVATALSVERIAPPKGLMYRTAATARRLQGRFQDALALLDEAVSRGLDHVSVLIDRHEVLLALGRRRDAEADLRRAQRNDPFDPRVAAAAESFAAAVPPRPR